MDPKTIYSHHLSNTVKSFTISSHMCTLHSAFNHVISVLGMHDCQVISHDIQQVRICISTTVLTFIAVCNMQSGLEMVKLMYTVK